PHRLPRSTLFPYTTLFRSTLARAGVSGDGAKARTHEFLPWLNKVADTTETTRILPRISLCSHARVRTCYSGRVNAVRPWNRVMRDRKRTRLNCSHLVISYA